MIPISLALVLLYFSAWAWSLMPLVTEIATVRIVDDNDDDNHNNNDVS